MNKALRYLSLVLAAILIYFVFFHETKIVNDVSIEVEEKEVIAEEPASSLGCNNERMKWKGHLVNPTGPFLKLIQIESVSNLKVLLPKKDSITILKIDSQNLRELPKELFQFTNLEALDISDNPFSDLEKLMQDLSKFPKLELLAMSHCGIITLPDNIALLDGLLGLSLDQNIDMIEVNENLGKLTKLRYLNFRRNRKLKDLPKSIGNLKCLEQINMSGAGFTRIREEITSCENLIFVTANASKIKYLPNGLGNLKKLKKLNLGANQIEKIPESIGEIQQLVDLSLGTNDISELPESITKLKNLYSIGLQLNRFKEFPKEVLELKGLAYLNLHNNYIKEIPLEVADLPRLKRIYVDHEIISDENIELLRKRNSDLVVERRDALRLVPEEPKRKY